MFSFHQVLNSSPEVKQYFGLYATSKDQCMSLALELIKEAIAKRKKKAEANKSVKLNYNPIQVQKQQLPQTVAQPKTIHHNVTYIKHNRFLSPSQKKQITPKVTQIIPIPSQNHFIYGKPKVKLDQYEGCQIHHGQNCLEESYENNNSSSGQQQNACANGIQMIQNKLYDDGVHIEQNYKKQQAMQIPHQYEEYLSPKNKELGKKKNCHDWNKTVKGGQKNLRENQSMSGLLSPKGSKQMKTSSKARITSPKSQMFNNQCCSQQNYSNVESKIKQLILRDKRNREVEKQLQKQKQQIDEIEERQNKLLIAQKQREEKLKNQADLKMQKEKQRQMEREREREREKEMEMEMQREMEKQREKRRKMQIEMEKERQIEIQMQIERQRERQRDLYRELQIHKESQIRREMQMQKQRQIMRQIQERQAEQAWRMRYREEASKLNQHMMRQQNIDLEGDFTSSSSSSIVNLHDHQLQQSRVQCYQCEIQRLRKQKQRAKQAIKQIELQEEKRSQVLMEIAPNSRLQTDYYRHYNNSMIY